MKVSRFMAVGMGGFFGAALRYFISCLASRVCTDFPLGTLTVNVLGGFLMGFLMELASGPWSVSDGTRMFLTTGLMGGLTTFSTFSYETISLFSDENYWMACLNVGLNLSLALLACWAGRSVARLIAWA